jgi:predicted small lipoprotein YifL
MKKNFLWATAIAACVAMTACGNKSEANANGADSTAVEATAAESEQNVIEDIHHIFSTVVPNGWTGEATTFGACKVKLVKKNDADKINAIINVNAVEGKEFDENNIGMYQIKAEHKVAEEKIGNYTWKIYNREEFIYAVAELPAGGTFNYLSAEGTISADNGGTIDDVKEALKGVKMLK